jgi:hypothetical protein
MRCGISLPHRGPSTTPPIAGYSVRTNNHIDTMARELAPKREPDILEVVEQCLEAGGIGLSAHARPPIWRQGFLNHKFARSIQIRHPRS